MTGSNRILLARPHPWIVEHMQGFLRKHGYEPYPLEDLKDLSAYPASSVRGAVISTSVISSVEESPAEAAGLIRKRYPSLPLAFATIATPDIIAPVLSKSLQATVGPMEIRFVDEETANSGALGGTGVAVMIHKDDIAGADDTDLADRIVREHFG